MNIKKLRTILLAFIAVPLAMMTSCSSDDEPQDENNKVAGTTWHSVDTNEHEVSSFFNDKTEPNTAVMTKIRQMSGLRYSVDTKVQTEDVYINLCEKSGHTNDGSMDLVFASEKCQVEVKTFRSVYKAKRTKTETVYKFEEGQYMVALGPSHYEGINVDNYGVYRANGTLYIPLDGNGCLICETKLSIFCLIHKTTCFFCDDAKLESSDAAYLRSEKILKKSPFIRKMAYEWG